MKYLRTQNETLEQRNQTLNSDNQDLSFELKKLQKNCKKTELELSYLKEENRNRITNNAIKFNGIHKKLENFSNNVKAIECDLKTLKLNYPNDCFIRVATVRRLNYTEISKLLEGYNKDIYFTYDNDKVRIYIGPTNSQLLLDQVKAHSFADALIDCGLKSEENFQTTRPIPKVKSTPSNNIKHFVESPQLEIYTPRFSSEILEGITLEIEGEEGYEQSKEIVYCSQGITYEYKDKVEVGEYIQLAAVKNFNCLNFADCQYITHVLVLRVYDIPNCRYRILSKELDKEKLIKKCIGFEKIEIKKM